MDTKRELKRDMACIIVDTYYGWQGPRKAFYNSVRNLVRKKIEALPLRVPESRKDDNSYIRQYIDENVEQLLEEIMGQDLTDEEREYIQAFMESGRRLKKEEARVKDMMLQFLSNEPLWNNFLQDVRGISMVNAINLLRYFDIDRARHPSSFWKYAGLHVDEDGKAPRRKKGENIDYNPACRTAVWNIGKCFIRSRNERYYSIYLQEKERQLTHKYKEGELAKKYGKPYTKEETELRKGHADSRALRYMVKMFLLDLYKVWKNIEYGATGEADEPYSRKFHKKV